MFAIESSFQVTPRVEWAAKLAARHERRTFTSIADVDTDSLLTVQRFNINIWRPLNLGVEYRLLIQDQTDDERSGFLGEVMWKLHKRMRVGVGYNFTDFSDNEFAPNDYSVHGWFIRVQGTY